MKRNLLLPLLCWAAAACGSEAAPPGSQRPDPEPQACTADADCEGEAICSAGSCVEKPAPAAWEAPTGPGSFGFAIAMAVSGERIAVSGYTHVLVSQDGGATWTPSAALPSLRQDQVVIAGNTLFVRNAGGVVFSSRNWGESWTTEPILASTIQARGSEVWILYQGEQGPAVRYSPDAIAWEELDVQLTSLVPGEETISGVDVHGATLLSSDGGRSWEELVPPVRIGRQPLLEWQGSLFGFSEESTGNQILPNAWVSHDGGASWDDGTFLQVPALSKSWLGMAPEGLFFLNSGGGATRLRNPDGSWDLFDPGLRNGFVTRAASIGPDGVFRTTDSGVLERWNEASGAFEVHAQGPVRGSAWSMVSDGASTWAIVDGTMIQRSDDGGRTWEVCPKPVENPGEKIGYDGLGTLELHEGQLWIGTAHFGMWRSGDGCRSWTPLASGMPHYNGTAGNQPRNVVGLHADDTGLWYCTGGLERVEGSEGANESTSVGIFHSVDGGATWRAARQGLPTAGANLMEQLYEPCNGVFAAGGTLFTSVRSGLFRSVGANGIWEGPLGSPRIELQQGSFPATLRAVVEHGDRLVALFEMGGIAPGLYASADGGATWEPLAGAPAPLLETPPAEPGSDGPPWRPSVAASLIEVGDELLVLLDRPGAVAADEGIWASADGGATWAQRSAETSKFEADLYELIATDGEFLVASYQAGVWRLPLQP